MFGFFLAFTARVELVAVFRFVFSFFFRKGMDFVDNGGFVETPVIFFMLIFFIQKWRFHEFNFTFMNTNLHKT